VFGCVVVVCVWLVLVICFVVDCFLVVGCFCFFWMVGCVLVVFVVLVVEFCLFFVFWGVGGVLFCWCFVCVIGLICGI
jgi:hypothetical protein